MVLVALVPCFGLDSLPARQSLIALQQIPSKENGPYDLFNLRSGEKVGGGAFDPGKSDDLHLVLP